jgi:uncharacterized protein YdeI (BOF family)
MTQPFVRTLSAGLAALALLAAAAPVLAEEETQTTTISAIDRNETSGMVYLEGAALERFDAEGYLFSDGTGVITLDIDTTTAEAAEVPLFTLIGVEGTVASDEIDVSSWAPLEIFTPAVIVTEPQVIDAFQGWIVAYGSQAPE